jgi:putative ABC transport system ATP-binding protein
MESLIALSNVSKRYETPAGTFPALEGIDLEIGAGEFVALLGRSGSGKSTLLNVLGAIDRPSGGEVLVAGTPLHREPEARLAGWRGKTVGFVFQFFQLLPTLTVLENVVLPMDFRGTLAAPERWARARDLLSRLGIAAHAEKLPSALSGGQQQRAAIARALANDPPLLLADEPTGNLDSATAKDVFDLLRGLASRGTTVVVATHERDLAASADRVLELEDGRLAGRA